jgi:DNA adenine methylase
LRSLITYYGGKGRMWRKIVPHFPAHHTYVEPFGGAANVLLNKRPSPVEVYNDINGEVVNMFRVLRDHPDELQRRLELTPYAREEWNTSLEEDRCDEIEAARRTVVKFRQSYAGCGGTWSSSVVGSRKGSAKRASDWISVADAVPAMAERFRQVQIECSSWEYVVSRYDTPGTLFYCDPPYHPEARSNGSHDNKYAHEMSEADHEELADALHAVEGHVVLSGYACPAYDSWFADWERVEFDVPLQADVTVRQRRAEVLWIKAA